MCKQFGIGIVKTVAIIANAILLLIAATLFFKCVVTYKQLRAYENVMDSSLQVMPLVGVIFGGILLFTIIFGFVGMILNAFGMICFYITLMIILGAVFAISSLYVLAEVGEMARDRLYFQNRMDQSYNITQLQHAIPSINEMQKDLQCCGFILGREQYLNENTKIPPSCCKDPAYGECFGEEIWPDNCVSKMEMFGIVTHSEQGTIMLCAAMHCFMLGGIGYVLAMAVRQYYYY